MSFNYRLIVVLAGWSLMTVGAYAADNTKPATKDPAGTELILANLRAWFARNANDRNEIGPVEAAKAFGYRRPYDAPTLPKTPTGNTKVDDKESMANSETSTIDSFVMTQKPKKSAYARRLDYLFISSLDKDGDEKVSKEEFEAWAHDYAVQLALMQIENQKMIKAYQQQLAQYMAKMAKPKKKK